MIFGGSVFGLNRNEEEEAMKKYLVMLMLSLFSLLSYSQQYMYVNTDTLPLREYPDYKSAVTLLLHAPCKIAVEEIADTSAEARELSKDWAPVKFFLSDGSWLGGTTYYGYVLKRHLVPDLSQVTVENVDTTMLLSVTLLATDSTAGKKPGVNFKETSTGECYYIDATAKRDYVGNNYCRRDDEEERKLQEWLDGD
jgi:hypothetical protein